ncbi:MAG: tRNA (adenosine(37)-N6)-threonylcarbamoyltransferase complex ATPase subunit type 1 TsaE [Gammaproteobacteria bacterium]|nr:tRNA (adenosine(37)-N6)-threonylcarbamoyltransferase complex ATPase subunit type 1 TsaE [Gammaproteobacteria bacterium]NVK89076.1 tRNA (adenosine(37)-N6)-threonylcarbamoyltransferase complex ATPase subunit type 1 TsaE [Gammaproteobacteria bacterium]
MQKQFVLDNEIATEQLGGCIGKALQQQSALVFLVGDLGAGKTTLVRGMLRAVGFTGSTKSPTYTLVEPYTFANWSVYHFDLYRVADPEELEYIGFDEYLADDSALVVVEWPERGEGWLTKPDLIIQLEYWESGRRATVTGTEPVLTSIANAFNDNGESVPTPD